ncbi:MAG: MFS transporter [Pirellulales bacterium]|nr:MFS transporter [Pirellulales bacterium]
MNQKRLFFGCFLSLIAVAFGFAVRGALLGDLARHFSLSNEQLGYLSGVGLYPCAISLILLSLFIDQIGYGRAMAFAFGCHVLAVSLLVFATSFEMLYWGTFVFAVANGTIEAVINPVVATIYDKNKTHWLNVLHAGWPGGLVLGGLLTIGVSSLNLDGEVWRWQMAIVLAPALPYGLILLGQKFPVQERVAAGVTYRDMLKEFGWGSAYICAFLLLAGINQALVVTGLPTLPLWVQAGIALVPAALLGFYVRSFGRPVFVFLLLIMFLLATTELGTDSWIAEIMQAVLKSPTSGTLFLVYTSTIMFILRFCAGPIVHRLSPLGLLAVCSAIAAIGLVSLSAAGAAVGLLLAAATLYGIGKTFFWPTTLGMVSELYPKGGALMLNAVTGVGTLAVGVLGGPAIGIVQDRDLVRIISEREPQLADQVLTTKHGILGPSRSLDQDKLAALKPAQMEVIEQAVIESKQGSLKKIATLPAIMFVCYLVLIVYFHFRGGYRAQVLADSSNSSEASSRKQSR